MFPAPAVILSALALLVSGLAIWSDLRGLRRLFYAAKPSAIVLIILTAAVQPGPFAEYKALILAGLLASLAGDILLMLPEKWFPAGLGSFLLAQGFYILAFRPGAGHPASAGTLIPFLVFGLLMFRTLSPGLGPLKFPVLVYIAAITAMAWFAAGRFVDLGGRKTLFAFAGAALFMASDSVLAYNRFVKKFGLAQAVILGTYFPAQLLIALSV